MDPKWDRGILHFLLSQLPKSSRGVCPWGGQGKLPTGLPQQNCGQQVKGHHYSQGHRINRINQNGNRRSDQGAQGFTQSGLVNLQGWRLQRIPLLSPCEGWNTVQYTVYSAHYYLLSLTKVTATNWWEASGGSLRWWRAWSLWPVGQLGWASQEKRGLERAWITIAHCFRGGAPRFLSELQWVYERQLAQFGTREIPVSYK